MKIEFELKQNLVNYETNTNLICFNEEVINKPAMEEGAEPKTMYLYDCARVKKGAGYGEIVTAIIRARYTADQVEAIVLNGSDTPDHEAEYTALQEWRAEAKRVAKQVLGQK